MLQQILGLIRHILTALGGGLVASGQLDANELEAGVGAVLAIIGVIWSWLSKRKTATPTEAPVSKPPVVPLRP